MEIYKLSLDERCRGEATWENKGCMSTIDFVFVNEDMNKINNNNNKS